MDRPGGLPDRCIVCNAGAGGYRVSRTLYWSPAAWKIFAVALPVVAAVIGATTQTPALSLAFWPLVVLLLIVHFLVRKRLEVEIGFCMPHRRGRAVLHALSIACIVGALGSILMWSTNDRIAAALLGISLLGIVAVMVAQLAFGLRTLGLKGLSAEHAWLTGTGKAFRAALPQLPG